jgi:hypothetical protein
MNRENSKTGGGGLQRRNENEKYWQCLNLKCFGALLSRLWHEIATWWYKNHQCLDVAVVVPFSVRLQAPGW